MQREIAIIGKEYEVEGLQAGRQSMFARPFKKRPPDFVTHIKQLGKDFVSAYPNGAVKPFDYKVTCPYGKPGDIIAVKETWNTLNEYFSKPDYHVMSISDFVYKADDDRQDKWKSPATMPPEAVRIYLEVEEVTCKRIQDVTEEEAVMLGVQRGIFRYGPNTMKGEFQLETHYKGSAFGNYTDGFKFLIHQLYGKEAFDRNEWHWLVKFKILSTTGKPTI